MDARMKAGLALLIAAAVCFPAQPAKKQHARRLKKAAPPKIEIKAEDVNNPTFTPPLSAEARGSGVVRVQILLDRQHFSSGEIDGYYGSNLTKAVGAYQESRNLPRSGNVDDATWASLNQDTAPVLIPYEI